jgi:hypothetical protein
MDIVAALLNEQEILIPASWVLGETVHVSEVG